VQSTFIQLKRVVAASPSPTRLGYPNCGIQDAGLYGGVCNGTRIVAGRCLTLQFGFLRGRSSPSLSIWPPSSPAEAHVDQHRQTRASSDRNAGETGRADPDSETASSAGLLPGLSISAQKELAVSAGGGPVSPESSAYAADSSKQIWSGRRDSNPRPQPWQGPPAAYARASLCIPEPAKSLSHQGFSCCSPSQAYPFSIPRLSLCRFPPASPAAAEGARSCDVCSGLKVVTKSANLAQTVA
jgi:hypothetical protein